MPVIFVPIAHGSSSSSHGLSIPSSVVYFLNKGVDPKEYIEKALKEAFPDYTWTKYEHGHFVLQKETGLFRDNSSDFNLFTHWRKYDRVSIISVLTMDEDGESLIQSLPFLYSLDKILVNANVLLQE